MSLADDYNLRTELASMSDVADCFDLWSNQLTWTPSLSVTAPMTIASASIIFADYYKIGDITFVFCRVTATIGGTSRNELRVSTPYAVSPNQYSPMIMSYRQPIAGSYVDGQCYPDSGYLVCRTRDNTQFTADTIDLNIAGAFRS
jgi:hypothetical protein